MTIAQTRNIAPLLSYQEYLAEGEICQRYDILDGVRIVPPAPLPLHQILLDNLAYIFGHYRRAGGQARALSAPLDVLINKNPLRVRQPDLMVIRLAAYRQRHVRTMQGPLDFAPDLVVEILSDSDRKKVLEGKLTDYASIGVNECWLVRPDTEKVEVLTLTGQKLIPVATYGQGESVVSVVFPDLIVSVAEIFAD